MKYILDTNVLKTISKDNPNRNVEKWMNSVDDSEIYLTVFSIMETFKGVELLKKNKNPDKVRAGIELEHNVNQLFDSYSDRILSLEKTAAKEWVGD